MTREQKELLRDIAQWRSNDFYNEMEEPWTATNYYISNQCNLVINKLEKEYKEKYGALPEWKYIDDVLQTLRELKDELEREDARYENSSEIRTIE